MITKKEICSLGAEVVGFSPYNGEGYLSKFKSVITIALPLLNSVVDEISIRPTIVYYSHYRTVNSLIDQISYKIGTRLESKGASAYPIAASQSIREPGLVKTYKGILSHKQGATASGLGWIGKSGLLINEDYGPRMRLGTILLDQLLEYDTPIRHSKCGDCVECMSACPAKAIRGNNWEAGVSRDHLFDASACSQYMKVNFMDIGRGSVCGICVNVCRFGR